MSGEVVAWMQRNVAKVEGRREWRAPWLEGAITGGSP